MTLAAMAFKRLVIFVRMFRVNALDFVSLTIQQLCSFHMAFNFYVIGVQVHKNRKACKWTGVCVCVSVLCTAKRKTI